LKNTSQLDPEPAPTARHEVTAFIVIGLLGIPLLALAVGLLFLPPGVCFVLIRRGLGEGHASWVVMGGIVGLLWIAMLWATARKFLHRQQRAPEEVLKEGE
jgi:hypothetical protein